MEVFYLPSYSPELNPDERLNAGLKHALGSRVALRTKAKLRLGACAAEPKAVFDCATLGT
jgi:transposase